MKVTRCLLPSLALCLAIPQITAALPFPNRNPGNKLTASDAADSDSLGSAVAISGNLAIVGAPCEDGAGTNRGAAYVYDLTSGAELFKLTASNAKDGDLFGASVAVSGNLAIIGAPLKNVGGSDSGAAYVYDLTTGLKLYEFTASTPQAGSQFGMSVGISGQFALVGAYLEDGVSTDFGAVYVFDLSTGNEHSKLTASVGTTYGRFGQSIAVSGNLTVIGTRDAAYVYELSSGTERFKLTASGAEEGEPGIPVAIPYNDGSIPPPNNNLSPAHFDGHGFGYSVAIQGNRAVVGSLCEDGSGKDRGAAYVYDLTSGAQLFRLTASDAADGDFFGRSVAVSGGLVLVGADAFAASSGAAYLYDLNSGIELKKLTASDGTTNDQFGVSVAASGNLAVVGALNEGGTGRNRGAAYVFATPDARPDVISGIAPLSGTGRGIINENAVGQATVITSVNLATVSGHFTVTNAGASTGDCRLSASRGNVDFSLRYFRRSGEFEGNVTAALIAGTQIERNVAANDPGRAYRAEVSPSSRLRRPAGGRLSIQRKVFIARFSAVDVSYPTRKDVAAILVITR